MSHGRTRFIGGRFDYLDRFHVCRHWHTPSGRSISNVVHGLRRVRGLLWTSPAAVRLRRDLEMAAACRVYIQLFVRRYIVNKKYMLCRICSLLLYAVGTVIWIICVLKPWKFMWTMGISITVAVYALMIIASLILAQNMKGG